MNQEFESFRKKYPGTKRGHDTEFNNFKKKHKDWKIVLPLLEPAVDGQIAYRKKLKEVGAFIPNWKNMQTWLNQRCWEEESGEIIPKVKDASISWCA